MSGNGDNIREAFDEWVSSVDKQRDANGWEPLTARDVKMLREGYMAAALTKQPDTVLVPRELLGQALAWLEANDAGYLTKDLRELLTREYKL